MVGANRKVTDGGTGIHVGKPSEQVSASHS